MEKQKLMVILLTVSLVLSALSTIGVGYLIVKQGQKPAFSQRMGGRGGQFGSFNGNTNGNVNGNTQNQNQQQQSTTQQ